MSLGATQRDVSSYLTNKIAGGGALTAGGTGDATEITGADIDRQDFLSCVFLVLVRATLAASKKIDIIGTLQDAPDSAGSAGTYADVAAALQPAGAAGGAIGTVTDSGSGSTTRTLFKLAVNLSTLRQWIRLKVTPDMNAANTDTAEILMACVLGGAVVNPDTLLS